MSRNTSAMLEMICCISQIYLNPQWSVLVPSKESIHLEMDTSGYLAQNY